MKYLQQVNREIGNFMTKEAKLLKIFRLLPLEQRNDVLSWVNLAHIAENSIRKTQDFDIELNNASSMKLQEYSCKNTLQRSKE